MRRRSLLVVLAALGLLAAACGSEGERSSSAAPAAVIECTGSQTRVLTPLVRAWEDGIHLRIENATGARLSLLLRQDEGGAGADAPAGVSELVTTSIVPGRAEVGCFDDRRVDPSEIPLASFEIVDPEDVWVSTVLDCEEEGTVFSDYLAGTRGKRGPPVEVARAFLAARDRLRPGDELEPAGYRKAERPVVRIVRSGETLATVQFEDDEHGGWLVSTVSACRGSGIIDK